MGGFLAKLSVSALMFDYILTGPTSGVSAGSYIMGLFLEAIRLAAPEYYLSHGLDQQDLASGAPGDLVKRWGAVLLCTAITLYFFWQNVRGIHESTDKALKIMVSTTIMPDLLLASACFTLPPSGPLIP